MVKNPQKFTDSEYENKKWIQNLWGTFFDDFLNFDSIFYKKIEQNFFLNFFVYIFGIINFFPIFPASFMQIEEYLFLTTYFI